MSERPIIVFDVNETLLDLDALRPTFDRIFNDPAAMRLWFADLILYSEALTLNSVYVRSSQGKTANPATAAIPAASRRPPVTAL